MKTKTLTNPRIKEANSFNRPGEIVGEWINEKVADCLLEYLTSDRRGLHEGRMDQDEAVACFESTLMRHAYDSICGQIEVAPNEMEVLNNLARRIALKAADAVRPMWMVEERRQRKSGYGAFAGRAAGLSLKDLPAAKRAHGRK